MTRLTRTSLMSGTHQANQYKSPLVKKGSKQFPGNSIAFQILKCFGGGECRTSSLQFWRLLISPSIPSTLIPACQSVILREDAFECRCRPCCCFFRWRWRPGRWCWSIHSSQLHKPQRGWCCARILDSFPTVSTVRLGTLKFAW